MSQVSSVGPGDVKPTERFRAREFAGLLIFVVVALLALLVVPYLLTQHNTELRRGLSRVVTPLSEHSGVLMRQTAAEVAAIRGYALTGDESLLGRFREVHAEAEETAARLREMDEELDEELAEAVHGFLQARRTWMTPNVALAEGEISREGFQARMPVQQQRYEAMLDAADRLDRALTRTVLARRDAIQRAETRRMWFTGGLAFLGLLAIGAVLWLGRRLHAASRRVEQQVSEQSELFRITQLLNEASDLKGALRRIARGVTEMARADGAHVEQINFKQDEIEIASTAGSGTPAVGTKVPYPGSLAEEVITSGEPEVTTADAMIEEGRPMASHLAATCSRCQILVVPLISEDAALGALLLNRSTTAGAFREDEIARIRILADMAALVLRRLYLFEEAHRSENALRQRTHELEKFKETLEERVEKRTEQVRELASRLTMAEQAERRRIAQMLHDDLQQRLYGIQMKMTFVRREAEAAADEELFEHIKQAYEWIEEAFKMTRRLTVDLSPPILRDEGLDGALVWLQSQMREMHGLKVELETSERAFQPLDEDMQVLLFQVIRELLFNVVKHAEVDRAAVALDEEENHFVIRVSDKGRGFDPAEVDQRGHGKETFGLYSIRERLRLFGGRMRIDAALGEGTRVTLQMPIEALNGHGGEGGGRQSL